MVSRRGVVLASIASLMAVNLASGADQREVASRVPWVYEGPGVSDTPLVGFVVLKSGTAPVAAATAVLRGFQALELSLGDCLGNDQRPRQNVQCTTDIAPLSPAVVNSYKAATTDPQYALPDGRFYGVKYRFKYQIQPSALVLTAAASLHSRGSGSASWIPYNRLYSARFFGDWITSSITEEFRKMSIRVTK